MQAFLRQSSERLVRGLALGFNPSRLPLRDMRSGSAAAVRPNPSVEARPNGKPPGPAPGCAIILPARAWRLAVGPASPRTLGLAPYASVQRHREVRLPREPNQPRRALMLDFRLARSDVIDAMHCIARESDGCHALQDLSGQAHLYASCDRSPQSH